MSAESLREQITDAIDSWWAEAELRTAHHDGVEHIASISLADAVLAVLGEVTVTEEWAVRYPDGAIGTSGGHDENAEEARRTGGQLLRRFVTSVERVGEWETAE